MRAENEKYAVEKIVISKTHGHSSIMHWPDPGKDLFGYDIKIGAFVIWQPYSAHDGMHIGQVVSLDKDDWIKIKTADNKTISRHGYELVLVMQQQMKLENEYEALH